jgi:hypothetical protein
MTPIQKFSLADVCQDCHSGKLFFYRRARKQSLILICATCQSEKAFFVDEKK